MATLTLSPTPTPKTPSDGIDRRGPAARRPFGDTSLDSAAVVLEAISSETHELTRDIQAGICDLNPAALPRLKARARQLRRIRELADITLATLARAGVEATPDDQPLVLLGPGPGFRTQLPAEPLGQRLDVEG